MAETPPTSPQRSQHAARQLERSTRAMHSPEGRRTPNPAAPSLSSMQPSTSNGQMGPPPPPLPPPAPALLQFTAPLTPSQFAAPPPARPHPRSRARPPPQLNHVGPVPVSLNAFCIVKY